jgi:hypothetical protein
MYGCTYSYNYNDSYNIQNIEKINLNAVSFEIKKNNFKSNETKNLISGQINKVTLLQFENWILRKFEVNGASNKAYINISKLKATLVEEKKENSFFLSLINRKKNTYQVTLSFDLNFLEDEVKTKTLKVSSKVDITLLNNYSIKKRNLVINYYANQLIYLIDEKVNKELKKETFNAFIVNQ